MSMIQLLGSAGSPFVRKTRAVLIEKAVEHEWIPDASTRPDKLVLKHNPLGKVPVIVVDEHQAIYDSRVIVEYLDALAPLPALLPPVGPDRILVKRWEALADGICDAAVLIVTERRRSIAAERSQEWTDKQRGKIDRALVTASHEIGAAVWCHGDGLTLADIALAVALAYLDFRFPEIHWREAHPNLEALHSRMSKRKSFSETAPPPA